MRILGYGFKFCQDCAKDFNYSHSADYGGGRISLLYLYGTHLHTKKSGFRRVLETKKI